MCDGAGLTSTISKAAFVFPEFMSFAPGNS